jgi:transcriptional regulator with XRE-family HTH domain
MIIPDQDHNKSPIDLNWLKDYGVKVINKSAFEITPEAGTETQATTYRIIQAGQELLTQGVKVTQKAIAKIVGMTQQNISKVLRAKGLTVEILEQKLMNILPNENTTGPIKDSIRASCITQELYKDFSAFFDLPIEDLIEDAIATIKTYGIDYFWEYLSNFPKALQGKYLMGLRHLLHDEPEFFSEVLIT